MLPSLRRVIWARCTHSLAQGTSQKIHRARVNTLLLGADRLLLTPRANSLGAYLMAKLSDDKFYNTYRGVAFMRLVRFCLERHLFDVALALHDRMLKEGFVAVHALGLRMSALGIAHRARDVAPQLKAIFKDEAYDVPAFMDLVRFLSDDKRVPAATVDDLAHAFVSTRSIDLSEHPDLVGELARINLRAGCSDSAQRWLQSFEDACGARGVLPDVTPYSDIITTLDDNGDAIQDVLVRMKSAGVSPDVHVFNTLIRVNLVQRRYYEAFTLYHLFFEKRSDALIPNDVTYKMLFRATNVLDRPRVLRRHKPSLSQPPSAPPPDNAVPPRQLVREMLTCHLEKTSGRPLGRSTVLSASALHLALRTFMARNDYAAAFVLVHILHAFGFQSNLQTYLIVLVGLLDRMKREVRHASAGTGACRLVDFITHVRPGEDPEVEVLCDRIRNGPVGGAVVGVDTLSRLLDLGECTRRGEDDLPSLAPVPLLSSSLPSPSSSSARRRAHAIPTVEMLTGAQADASSSMSVYQTAHFSPVPLARIVHKALLGELFRKALHRGVGWDWKSAAGVIVNETKGEIVPEGVVWEGRTGERAERGRGVLPFAAARIRRRRRGARGGREVVFDFEE